MGSVRKDTDTLKDQITICHIHYKHLLGSLSENSFVHIEVDHTEIAFTTFALLGKSKLFGIPPNSLTEYTDMRISLQTYTYTAVSMYIHHVWVGITAVQFPLSPVC